MVKILNKLDAHLHNNPMESCSQTKMSLRNKTKPPVYRWQLKFSISCDESSVYVRTCSCFFIIYSAPEPRALSRFIQKDVYLRPWQRQRPTQSDEFNVIYVYSRKLVRLSTVRPNN